MNFERFPDLEGKHAFLSPSQHSWVRYDKDKLVRVYKNKQKVEFGTKLHEFAKSAIDLGVYLKQSKTTLDLYVNDCIKDKMQTEVCLFYSKYCFGWADAINYDASKKYLRIYDLKTGETPASMEQLVIYASLFCLQYKIDPSLIKIELRLYQTSEVLVHKPEPDDIKEVMNVIINDCLILEEYEKGV